LQNFFFQNFEEYKIEKTTDKRTGVRTPRGIGKLIIVKATKQKLFN
jgi:hypothetical protein